MSAQRNARDPSLYFPARLSAGAERDCYRLRWRKIVPTLYLTSIPTQGQIEILLPGRGPAAAPAPCNMPGSSSLSLMRARQYSSDS
jgi:hypothetical protein